MSDDWPATRIGALLVDAILLALTILHAIYSQCTLHRVRAAQNNPSALVSSFYRFFRLYMTGYTVVQQADESGAIIAEYHSLCRLGGCSSCCGGTTLPQRIDNIPRSTSDRITITPRPWTVSEFSFHVDSDRSELSL